MKNRNEGVTFMVKENRSLSGGVSACLAILLGLTGCERPSKIVKMVENSGAGDLRTASVGSMVRWLEKHPVVAMKADNLCLPA